MNDTGHREERLTLELLGAIEERSDINQRHLAQRMGVALGLANAYLKRCARKGLIKIREVPANRYLYYLTPHGFAEKARLTGRFLSTSLAFYRQASDSVHQIYAHCLEQGWHRLVLAGVSDLTEIALLRLPEHAPIRVLGVFDGTAASATYQGRPVWHALDEIPETDAVVLTELSSTVSMYRTLATRYGDDRLLIPRVLGLSEQVAAALAGGRRTPEKPPVAAGRSATARR
jgi:DNA-binding MarR family transcriptional regulator